MREYGKNNFDTFYVCIIFSCFLGWVREVSKSGNKTVVKYTVPEYYVQDEENATLTEKDLYKFCKYKTKNK